MKAYLKWLLLTFVAMLFIAISHVTEAHAVENLNYTATMKVKNTLYANHPGTKKIMTVPKGAQVTFHYTQSNSWGYVTYKGKKGYIMTAYLNIDDKGKSSKLYDLDPSKIYTYRVYNHSLFESIHRRTKARPETNGTKYPYTSYTWYDKSDGYWHVDTVPYHTNPWNTFKLDKTKFDLVLWVQKNGRFLRSHEIVSYGVIANTRYWDMERTKTMKTTMTTKVLYVGNARAGGKVYPGVMGFHYADRTTLYFSEKNGIIWEKHKGKPIRELLNISTNPNY